MAHDKVYWLEGLAALLVGLSKGELPTEQYATEVFAESIRSVTSAVMSEVTT